MTREEKAEYDRLHVRWQRNFVTKDTDMVFPELTHAERHRMIELERMLPEPRDLNWQDCRDAAADAAANLAHCYAASIKGGSELHLQGEHARVDYIEEMVKRELRTALHRGMDLRSAENDETINLTGDQFE